MMTTVQFASSTSAAELNNFPPSEREKEEQRNGKSFAIVELRTAAWEKSSNLVRQCTVYGMLTNLPPLVFSDASKSATILCSRIKW